MHEGSIKRQRFIAPPDVLRMLAPRAQTPFGGKRRGTGRDEVREAHCYIFSFYICMFESLSFWCPCPPDPLTTLKPFTGTPVGEISRSYYYY